uniref:Ferric-chelate reductase 1 n=1 Tax=Acrobeloides nanus TaxID=290746 RepID=A0A914CM84_9BILA
MKPLQLALLLLYLYVGCLTVHAFNTDECNTKKKCISFPVGCLKEKPSECEYLFSYAPSEDKSDAVVIELATKHTENVNKYVAVGFSNDKEMGGEPVSTCSFVNNNVTVHLTRNLDNTKANQPSEENPLQQISGGQENGLLYCKFQQHTNKNVSSTPELPDLSRSYFLFIARGPIGNPSEPTKISLHSLDHDSIDFPQITPSKINLLEALPSRTTSTAAQPTDYKFLLVRFHARYMRELWPTTTPMGLKIWFHIHRTLNFVAVCCLVVSTILVFIAKDITWKGPWFGREQERNLSWGSIHSLVGLLAVIGGVAQPFIALTRCGVDHPRRPIFNWVHRIIGLVAFVLATIAIFIAVIRFKRYWADPTWSLICLIVYCLLVIGVVVAIEWHRIRHQTRPHPGGFEMRTKGGRHNYMDLHSSSSQIDDQQVKRATIGSFAAFVLVAGVFTGILFYMLLP